MEQQNLNLDGWRLERLKFQRQEAEVIDNLCAALLNAQAKIQALEAEIIQLKPAPEPVGVFLPSEET